MTSGVTRQVRISIPPLLTVVQERIIILTENQCRSKCFWASCARYSPGAQRWAGAPSCMLWIRSSRSRLMGSSSWTARLLRKCLPAICSSSRIMLTKVVVGTARRLIVRRVLRCRSASRRSCLLSWKLFSLVSRLVWRIRICRF